MKQFLAMWIRRFRTMVRYRLLFLTSVPIIITLLVLIALTMYWTVMYTWQNALKNVRADLAVAHHSMELLQKEQRMRLTALSESYDFQYLLRNDEAKLSDWVRQQASRYDLDFVVLHPASALGEFSKANRRLLMLGEEQTFFQQLDEMALENLHSNLPARAQIPLLSEGETESKGW